MHVPNSYYLFPVQSALWVYCGRNFEASDHFWIAIASPDHYVIAVAGLALHCSAVAVLDLH